MRFVACEPRLSEAVALYRESGFEVHLEPLVKYKKHPAHMGDAIGQEECRICFKGVEDQYSVIYTRPETTGASS